MSHAKIQVVEESRYSNCNWFTHSWTFCVDCINIRSCGTITMKQTMDKTKTYSFRKLSLSPKNNYSLQTRAIIFFLPTKFWIRSIKTKQTAVLDQILWHIFSAFAFALKLFVCSDPVSLFLFKYFSWNKCFY